MKHFLYIAIVIALSVFALPVSGQPGTSCSNPIRMGKNYSENITGTGTKWYVANTFDLPLTVQFYPNSTTAAAPDIEMDFSCTNGVYEDSILCSLFCHTNSGYIALPYHVTPDQKTDDQGNLYYEVAMGEFYRDMLLRAGISYDVDVFVKVTYHCPGSINITPDIEFSQCFETDQWLLLGRTLPVAANDAETFFIAPYANWTQDSIRYIWSGAQPATVVIGTTCDYDPLDVLDDRRVDVMEMNAGGDTVNHTNADIAYYMTYMRNPTNTAKGGMFYVKVVSAGPGTLKIERMPPAPAEGGAVILLYNEETNVSGDINSLYAIPRTWTTATRFFTPTDRVFKMYIGTSADFSETDAIGVYQFNVTEGGHWFGLTQTEMEALWAQTSSKYLYVRFVCSQPTTITPSLWTPSDCIGRASIIRHDTTLSIGMRSKVIYRFYYYDWKGGDMTLTWSKARECKMLVSGDCSIGTSETAEGVFTYRSLTNSAYVIPADTLAKWADNVDADGYFYVRFYSNTNGTMTISTTAPEETDPVDPPVPVPHATINIVCLENTNDLQVSVSVQQAIQINDADGNPVWQQTVQPGQPQNVSLPQGRYLLIGENEQIEIHL